MKRVLRHASRTPVSCLSAVLVLVLVAPLSACTRSASDDSSARTETQPQEVSSPSPAAPDPAAPDPAAPDLAAPDPAAPDLAANDLAANDGGAGAAVLPAPPPVPATQQQTPAASTAPRTTVFVYDSIEEFLTPAGSRPSGSLAGYQLGSPDGARSHTIIVTGYGRGDAYAMRDADGKVRHINVELYPGRPDAESKHGFDEPYGLHDDRAANSKIIAAFKARVTARWGKPGRSAERAVWRSEQSELYLVQALDSGGSGYLMLSIDLLPTGGTHVCGPRDGFRAYYKKFRRQLRAALKDKDVAAITTLLDMQSSREVDLKDDSPGARARLIGYVAALEVALPSSPAKLACNLSGETWYWVWDNDPVEDEEDGQAEGYIYVAFSRDDQGKWQASGPHETGNYSHAPASNATPW